VPAVVVRWCDHRLLIRYSGLAFSPSADAETEMASRPPLVLNRPTATSPFFSVLAKIWYVAVSAIRAASMAS
jgi:hypothetical protein